MSETGDSTDDYKTVATYHMTDVGNAKHMDSLFGGNLLYCAGSKKWLIWDLARWREDNLGVIYKLARDSIETIHNKVNGMEYGELQKKMHKHALASESMPRIKAMVEVLQSTPGIMVSMDKMNLNDWILPVQNGTIELKTGRFRQSECEDMCTKLAHVYYDPAAKCPEFDNFLLQIIPDNDTRRYVQECLGYALTGDTSEENIFFNYGTGSNGKSVLMDTVSRLMGDYAVNIKASTLLTSNENESPSEHGITMLHGARLVTSSEPKKGMKLSEDVIKAITNGNAKVTARRLYQEPFEFYPTHKVFFSTNHKPTVVDHTRGIWRRLRLIPFVTSIEDEDQDLQLSAKLEKELPGILNWLIEGCLSWQKAGRLIMSDLVKQETDEYREEMDRISEFLELTTIAGDADDRISSTWLRDQYNKWAEEQGFNVMNAHTFGAAMIERDYKKVKSHGIILWIGLKEAVVTFGDSDYNINH